MSSSLVTREQTNIVHADDVPNNQPTGYAAENGVLYRMGKTYGERQPLKAGQGLQWHGIDQINVTTKKDYLQIVFGPNSQFLFQTKISGVVKDNGTLLMQVQSFRFVQGLCAIYQHTRDLRSSSGFLFAKLGSDPKHPPTFVNALLTEDGKTTIRVPDFPFSTEYGIEETQARIGWLQKSLGQVPSFPIPVQYEQLEELPVLNARHSMQEAINV